MISVIMTTYNCGAFISESIRSILSQSIKEIELIIVDDGSTDTTEQIIAKIKDERIKYHRIEHSGRSAALNYAVLRANYKIIALQDADDISHPLRLEKELKYLGKENEIVFTTYAAFKKNKIVFVNPPKPDVKNDNEKFFIHGHFNNSSSMFYKNLLIENGMFNEQLEAYEDYDFWLRIFNKAEFKTVPEVLHYTRLRKNSLSSQDSKKLNKIIYEIQMPYYERLSDYLQFDKPEKEFIVKGWREFFYGSKSKGRYFWAATGITKWNLKILIAYLFSLLPDFILTFIKRGKFRLRIAYLFETIKNKNSYQKEFEGIRFRING